MPQSTVWVTTLAPMSFSALNLLVITWMMPHSSTAFAADISIRLADEKLPPAGIAFDAHDVGPGIVYEG